MAGAVHPLQRRRGAGRGRARRRRGPRSSPTCCARCCGRSRRSTMERRRVRSSAPRSSPTCRRWCCPRRAPRAQRRQGDQPRARAPPHEGRGLDRLRPDTIVVFDAHWHTTVEFVVAAHDRRPAGTRRRSCRGGCRQMPYDFPGDPELAELIAEEVDGGRLVDDADRRPVPADPLPDDEPAAVPAGRRAVGQRQHGPDGGDRRLPARRRGDRAGRRAQRSAGRAAGQRGDEPHVLEAARAARPRGVRPGHIRTPEARAADLERLAWLEAGDHARVIDTMPEFLRYKPEAMFGHYLMMVAAIGGRVRGPGRRPTATTRTRSAPARSTSGSTARRPAGLPSECFPSSECFACGRRHADTRWRKHSDDQDVVPSRIWRVFRSLWKSRA